MGVGWAQSQSHARLTHFTQLLACERAAKIFDVILLSKDHELPSRTNVFGLEVRVSDTRELSTLRLRIHDLNICLAVVLVVVEHCEVVIEAGELIPRAVRRWGKGGRMSCLRTRIASRINNAR